MNNIESDEAYSDDTTIISELLNSAEEMHICTLPTTNDSTVKLPLQQKDESQTGEVSATFCDTSNRNVLASLQQNRSAVSCGLLTYSERSDMDDLNKMPIRHMHIPYILNGELYQIQTQDGENVTVKCCHCPPDRVYRGSVRSTGNFHMHIKRRHPDLLEKLHDMKVNALLERRDRLMRNRKINRRNRSTNCNDMCSFNNDEKTDLHTSPDSQIILESSLMHTHKLKIKTAFQRHQMQQREAEEMRIWGNKDYIVMPIGQLPMNEYSEQPINYSLRSRENNMVSTDSLNVNQEENKMPHIITQTCFDNFPNFNNQPTNVSNCNTSEQNKSICENHSNNSNLPSTSTLISCPSVITSYTSSSHQCELEINRPYNSFSLQHHNLPIIKPEQFILGGATEAIDLTVHTDSGIFSSSEDDDSVNNNDTRINNMRDDTQMQCNASADGNDNNNTNSNTAKWQELLIQVENSLRDIQREMNVRNQIESNRMFLDVAKFKFLNPGFQFNW